MKQVFQAASIGLLVEFVDFRVELVEGGAQRTGQLVVVGEQGGPLGPEDAQIELAVEEGDFEAVAGRGVAMRLRDAMDQAFEAQPPQVVGHLRGRIRAPEERCDLRAEVAVAEAAREMGEAGEGLEERHDARVAEAQGGRALAGFDGGLLEPVEGVLGQDALMTDALDFEELAIDLIAQVPQDAGGSATAFAT